MIHGPLHVALLLALLGGPPVGLEDGSGTLATAHHEFHYGPGLAGLARALSEGAEAHRARIYGELGVDSDATTTVFVVSDEVAMRARVAERKRQIAPDWAAGLAFPKDREIYLHAGLGQDELDLTFQHETSHVAFGAATDHPDVPRWFKEGLAIRQSEGLGLERVRILTEAALAGGLMSLDDLSLGFPRSSPRAGLAYAQSIHFVGYLRDRFGADLFTELIAHMRDRGLGFREAAEATYPLPLTAIEAAWRDRLTVWWGWVPVLFGSTTLWTLTALLAIFAWRRRKGQQRLRLAAMAGREAEELATELELTHSIPQHTGAQDPYEGRPPTIH